MTNRPIPVPVVLLDPFDLPDWLGTEEVHWHQTGTGQHHLLPGALVCGEHSLTCDLFAVDLAYPAPVADEATRVRVHQAWQHGQVVLVRREGRTSVAAPGTSWSPATVLEAVRRVALAVGAPPARYAAVLRPDLPGA